MNSPGTLNLRFRRNRAVLALVAAGIIVFGALGIELWDSYRSSLEKAHLQSSNLSLLLAERVTGTLNETDYVLRDVAGRILPRAEASFPTKAELGLILEQKAATLPQVSSLVLYGPTGTALASSDGRFDGGAAGYGFFERLRASDWLDSSESRVYRNSNGRYVVTLARAIRGPRHGLLAVAAAEIGADYFQNELAKLDVGARGLVALIDDDLHIVALQPFKAGSTGAVPADRRLFELLGDFTRHHEPGGVAYIEGPGLQYSIRACQDFPFIVVVANARSEALAVWTVRIVGYAFSAALVCILLALLARSVNADLRRSEQLAHYDILTGLPNRVLYFDRLAGAVSRARREGGRFALLYVDLDGFKPINDRFGHACGDEVLRETAHRMRSVIRDSDTAARMGGDEFTVLLERIAHPADASAVAEKIAAAIAKPMDLPENRSCSVRASVGVAIFPDDADEGEALLRFADASMYERKKRNAEGSGAQSAPEGA